MNLSFSALPRCFSIMGLLLGAHSLPAQTEVRRAIERVDRQIEQSIHGGDSKRLASLYAVNAKLMPPNDDFVSGAKNIQDYWQQTMDKGGVKAMKLDIAEVYSCGNTATEIGTYVVFDASNKAVDTGKYIVFWKLEKEKWKLYRDQWSSNQPER